MQLREIMVETKRKEYPAHRKYQHVQMKALLGLIEREIDHQITADLPKKIRLGYLKEIKEMFAEITLRLD